MKANTTVKLGGHEYIVVDQPLAYLEQELGDVFGALSGVDTPGDLADVAHPDRRPGRSGLGEITGPGYDVLKVFIPELMPEHEFRGYATEEAFRAGGRRSREELRNAPTVPQIVGAFETVFKVNRLDVVKHLGKVIDSDLVAAFLKEAIGDGISQLLLSSLSESGESASTTPSAPPQTPPPLPVAA